MMQTNSDLLMPIQAAFDSVAALNVNPETLRRWTRRGLKGVRLRCWRVAGRYLTKPSEVLEFIQKTNEPREPVA